jgi:hypothetical protein
VRALKYSDFIQGYGELADQCTGTMATIVSKSSDGIEYFSAQRKGKRHWISCVVGTEGRLESLPPGHVHLPKPSQHPVDPVGGDVGSRRSLEEPNHIGWGRPGHIERGVEFPTLFLIYIMPVYWYLNIICNL